MIERYSRLEMSKIWSRQTTFELWQEIECKIAMVMSQLGIIPAKDANIINQRAGFDINRIDQLEQKLKHDVLAFLTNMSENIGESARYLHYGMTSSDLLDSCFALQLTRACDLLTKDIDALCQALKRRAFEHKDTLCIGRSHGIHAEPTSFGLKLAGFYAEFQRNRKRLANARQEIGVIAISGAVGTYAHIPPSVEEKLAKELQLKTEQHSTQVIPRDRHAVFFTTLAVIAASIERIAVEIRHLQRTEVGEVEEFFDKEQKGSSAMPHKRNPILSENLTGLARLVRSYVMPALENIALWHERDMSHSSVERVIAPDATITLDFALDRMTSIIDKLIVYPENMQKNLQQMCGLIYSQKIMLALIDKGLERESAYRIVQNNSMKVWQNQQQNLQNCMEKDPQVQKILTKDEIEKIFDGKNFLKHSDYIFDKIFSNTD